MILSKGTLLSGTLALAVVSCADQPAETPAEAVAPEPSATAKPEPADPADFKKKPRMNGRGKVTAISFEDFFARHQSGEILLFDARPAFIYQLGRIPGAINLTKLHCDGKIHAREEQIKQALAEGKIIVVYCSGLLCPDARTVAHHFSGFGYPASVFSGGWDAWTAAGMPTE